jgi:hypothetical protein
MPGAGAPVAEATGAVTVETTGATADVAADTTELPVPGLPLPEPPLPEPWPEPTGCGTAAEVADAAADVTAERAEPAPEPELGVDCRGVGAAEAAGAAVEPAGAAAGEADGAAEELAGAGAGELAGAGAGAAEVAAGVTAPEPELAVAGCELVEGGGVLASEAAPFTADVAWETACPTADEPVPEPPWDAPDVACVTVETADPSTDDGPPADDEPPPPESDAADAVPAVRTENPMARPMAATTKPAAYRHSRRTLVTTPRATSGNLARHVHDVDVRERTQFGQMSTRSPLIPRSTPGSAHHHFRLLLLRTDVPGPDRPRPDPA